MFSVVTKSIIRGRIFSFRSMANWRNSDIVWVDMEMTGKIIYIRRSYNKYSFKLIYLFKVLTLIDVE